MSATGAHIGRPIDSRRLLVALATLFLMVAVAGYAVVRWNGHGDPDPGGRILSALTSIEVAIPDGATNVTVNHAEPHWDSCDGREGTFGWSSIGVYVSFGTGMTPDSVLGYATARLKSAGWSEGRTLSSPLGHGQEWTRALSEGTNARALLAPGTNGATTRWELTATAAPHGQQVSGC